MDEVEDAVRTALRDNAALITQDSLRHTAPPAARPRKGRSAVLVAAAFVLAAGGVTTAVTLRGGDGPGHQWGVEAGSPAYVGFHWNLRKVGEYDVPPDLRASASFLPGGDFRLFDGTNSMFGRYEATTTSVRLRDVGRTFALYAGNDPVRRAVIAAMDELTVQEARVSVSADRLVVTTKSHEMVFARGDVATSAAPSSR